MGESIRCLLVGLANISVLVAMVLQIKTTNPHIRVITGILLKVVISFFLAFTFSPFIVLAVTLLLPGRKSEAEVARMGKGKTSTKVAVIAIATTLLCWELVSCSGMCLGVANIVRGYEAPRCYRHFPRTRHHGTFLIWGLIELADSV